MTEHSSGLPVAVRYGRPSPHRPFDGSREIGTVSRVRDPARIVVRGTHAHRGKGLSYDVQLQTILAQDCLILQERWT